MLSNKIFENAFIETTPSSITLGNREVTREFIQENGLILDYTGRPGESALILTSRMVSWSPNKLSTSMLGNQVLSLIRYDNKESVVKCTVTAPVELDGEVHMGSALFICPRLNPSDDLWQEEVLGTLAKWGHQLQLIAEFYPALVGDELDFFTRSNSPEIYLRLEVNSYVLWIPNKEHEVSLTKIYGTSRRLVKAAPIGSINRNKPQNKTIATGPNNTTEFNGFSNGLNETAVKLLEL